MSMMDKAFGAGRPKPQIEGAAIDEKKLSPQEKMIVGLLKSALPGLDLDAIAKMGNDVQEFAGRVAVTLHAHSEALARIEANQLAILARLPAPPEEGQ